MPSRTMSDVPSASVSSPTKEEDLLSPRGGVERTTSDSFESPAPKAPPSVAPGAPSKPMTRKNAKRCLGLAKDEPLGPLSGDTDNDVKDESDAKDEPDVKDEPDAKDKPNDDESPVCTQSSAKVAKSTEKEDPLVGSKRKYSSISELGWTFEYVRGAFTSGVEKYVRENTLSAESELSVDRDPPSLVTSLDEYLTGGMVDDLDDSVRVVVLGWKNELEATLVKLVEVVWSRKIAVTKHLFPPHRLVGSMLWSYLHGNPYAKLILSDAFSDFPASEEEDMYSPEAYTRAVVSTGGAGGAEAGGASGVEAGGASGAEAGGASGAEAGGASGAEAGGAEAVKADASM